MSFTADEKLLFGRLDALTEGVDDDVSNLANAASLLYGSLGDVNWAGFYILKGDKLTLGPFMGKPACVYIPVGRGVCGSAVSQKRTLAVPDVSLFDGHIACDADSRSEIVVPLFVGGELYGVMDIDSPSVGRFGEDDIAFFEEFAVRLSKSLGGAV